MRTPTLAALLALATLALPARATSTGSVLVVAPAPGPGVDFTDLQAAVDAAAPGDTLLVRAGDYDFTRVLGKGLALVGDVASGGRPLVQGLNIEGLPAEQSLLVSGIDLRTVFLPPWSLSILDCAGFVRVQDVAVLPPIFLPSGANGTAALVQDSPRVTLVRVSSQGSEDEFTDVGNGLSVARSTLLAFDAVLTGARGSTPNELFPIAGQGGNGLQLAEGCEVLLAGGAAAGGPGGGEFDPFAQPPCFDGGQGGTGARVEFGLASNRLVHVGAELLPGPPGEAHPPCSPGTPGTDLVVGGGAASALAGPASELRRVSSGVLAREGEALAVTFAGAAGEAVAWFVGFEPALVPLPGKLVPLLVDPALAVLVFPGTLSASGELTLAPVIPELGFDGLVLHQQAFFFAPTGGRRASNPEAVVLLDAAL